MIEKPRMRPITIEIDQGIAHYIKIEALTEDAKQWVRKHAPEFGDLKASSIQSRRWDLLVYTGYNRTEVVDYLQGLWDSQSWPEEIEHQGEVGQPVSNTVRKILAGIACEIGQLDGAIAMMQEARDKTDRTEVRKEIHADVLDHMSRRNGLYKALRIAADVVEIGAAELADIATEALAQKLTAELRMEAKKSSGSD